eukprot:TRINITY_DN6136_c0_g4_i1.p1 TRINITY_DN6136_c0_g4~~TRINITY_DN6136_c0_g4_i1.p1  ORF type:complete len:254 (-),score=44.99 TRINITY_DN6136_c0_g4_i1:98-859(-)
MGSKLFVRNLPADIQESEVQYIFGKYGIVLQVELILGVNGDVAIQYQDVALAPVVLHILPSSSSKSRPDQTCAFVTYSSVEAATTAIRVLNNVYRVRSSSKEPISVRFAQADEVPEPERPSVQASAVDAFAALPPAVVATPRKAALGGFSNGPASATYAHVAEKAKCKLFVGNLYPEITQEALANVFSAWGSVVHVHIKTGKSRFGSACAFVELALPQQAELARQALHQRYDPRIGAGGAPIQVTFFQSGGKR